MPIFRNLFVILHKLEYISTSKYKIMALAVKAIPTLYGEEAREFRDRADEVERRYLERPKRDLNNDPLILEVRKMWANILRD